MVDLESGALIVVTVQGADQSDTRTLVTTAITAAEQVEAVHRDVRRVRDIGGNRRGQRVGLSQDLLIF